MLRRPVRFRIVRNHKPGTGLGNPDVNTYHVQKQWKFSPLWHELDYFYGLDSAELKVSREISELKQTREVVLTTRWV